MTYLILLAATLAWLAWRRWWQRRPGQVALDKGSAAYFLRWSERIALTYGVPGIVGAVLLGSATGIPDAFLPLAMELGYGSPFPTGLLLLGIAGGSLIAALIAWWRGPGRRWFGPPLGEARTLGAAGAALLLAGTAGVAEEALFRWLLPLLIAGTGAGALVGFALSSVLFGLLHRYQRWLGVLATGVAGALFAWVYLASGWLWLAMLVHALVDVNALLLRPWAARLRTSAASRSGR